jgi:hypothetical protein
MMKTWDVHPIFMQCNGYGGTVQSDPAGSSTFNE